MNDLLEFIILTYGFLLPDSNVQSEGWIPADEFAVLIETVYDKTNPRTNYIVTKLRNTGKHLHVKRFGGTIKICYEDTNMLYPAPPQKQGNEGLGF